MLSLADCKSLVVNVAPLWVVLISGSMFARLSGTLEYNRAVADVKVICALLWYVGKSAANSLVRNFPQQK